ncbi:MAG: hypothetical protein ACYCQK_01670 [Acidiferrobacteraceae bacterium]
MAASKPNPYAGEAFPAGSASLTQFQFVEINSSGQIVTPTATGVFALVLNDAPALAGATITNDMPSGGYVVGAYYGCISSLMSWVKVISGAALTAGQAVQTDTSGHAVPLLAGGVTLGYAIAASNSGDIVQLAPA